MLEANHVLQKLKTAHRKLLQISPYCYFFLAQLDIKFPPFGIVNQKNTMTGVAMTTKQGQRFLSMYEIDIYRQCFPIFTYFA